MDIRAHSRFTPFGIVAITAALLLSGCSAPGPGEATGPTPSESVSAAPTTPAPQPTETSSEGQAGSSTPSPSPAPTSSPTATPTTPAPTVGPTPSATPTPTPTPTVSPTPPPPAAPSVAVLTQRCVSNKLTVGLAASYDSGHQKGIQKVVVERANEYNAWIAVDATWLGIYTGKGDEWTVQPAGSRVLRYKDTLRITATATDGTKTTIEESITAPC